MISHASGSSTGSSATVRGAHDAPPDDETDLLAEGIAPPQENGLERRRRAAEIEAHAPAEPLHTLLDGVELPRGIRTVPPGFGVDDYAPGGQIGEAFHPCQARSPE